MMNYTAILVTGGAGFVGSHIALRLKDCFPGCAVTALDNLIRKGSELNVPRLDAAGVRFVRGDVRNPKDLASVGAIDLVIECSAECSVLAGYHSSARYLIDTNLMGAVNCLEHAKEHHADFIFLSTSRVYPIEKLRALALVETETRLSFSESAPGRGVSGKGINEDFPLDGYRSFYGSSKLAAEHLVEEYIHGYGMRGVINRCGVIAGPWQMGKVDQGVITLWVARHLYQGQLSYIGFRGKQVRDVLDVDDLWSLLELQIDDISHFSGKTFNVGGGIEYAVSLRELTALCEQATGNRLSIPFVDEVREADVPYYVSDYSAVQALCGWQPRKTLKQTLAAIADWIREHSEELKPLLA